MNVMDHFEFNVPVFDFIKGSFQGDEKVEAYFDVDHERILHSAREEERLLPECDIDLEELNFYSPMATPEVSNNDKFRRPRRSLSEGHIQLPSELRHRMNKLSEALNEINITSDDIRKGSTSPLLKKKRSRHSSTSRLHRSSTNEHLNRLAQPKYRAGSMENLRKNDYVSMAEAVNKFQKSTPVRFRSRPPSPGNHLRAKLMPTIPHSPALLTKARHRPLNILSTEDREEMEFKEQQKFKIKAHPVSKKVLQGPLKPQVPIEKKPNTVPEPFKITSVSKKVPTSPKTETFKFHAKPVPKSVFEPPKPLDLPKQVTRPQTPNFSQRFVKEKPKPVKQRSCDNLRPQNPESSKPLTKTLPVPFSFQKRDEQIIKRKEELINKFIEEEKKAREFHARPLPRSIFKSPIKNNSQNSSNPTSVAVGKTNKSEENLASVTTFKARPATVLYKKPFEPKKGDRPLTEITEFQLNTDRRSKEREEFDQKLKEKEELIALLKQRQEEERLRREEEEVAILRKQAEHKAQPIKKFKEFVILPSNKVTEPISPKFHTDRIRNKENSNRQ